MALRSALVDRAYVKRRVADEPVVNGRRPQTMTESAAIRCRVSVNDAAERNDEGRKVTDDRPTLTIDRRDADGVEIRPRKTDRLRIVSRELGEGTYEIEGKVKPIRKKRRIIGWTCTVVQLEED